MQKRETTRAIARLDRQLRKLEKEEDALIASRDQLVKDLIKIRPGDEVVYIGPDPARFISGIVREVAIWRKADRHGRLATITVQPWARKGSRVLTRTNEVRRHFTDPALLRIVYPAAKVPSYTRTK